MSLDDRQNYDWKDYTAVISVENNRPLYWGIPTTRTKTTVVGSTDDVWDDAGLDIARWTSQYPPV